MGSNGALGRIYTCIPGQHAGLCRLSYKSELVGLEWIRTLIDWVKARYPACWTTDPKWPAPMDLNHDLLVFKARRSARSTQRSARTLALSDTLS